MPEEADHTKPAASEERPIMQSSQWESVDTTAYDRKWQQMAASGQNPHGEADLIEQLMPQTTAAPTVLDAGCGTGRLAIELARRGMTTVGVDLDGPMIEAARQKAPELEWHQSDLAALHLEAAGAPRLFDVIAMAGNVMIFVAPGTEGAVLQRLATHLRPGGVLISGFQLNRGLSLAEYDQLASAASLGLVARYATWDGAPFTPESRYAVSVSVPTGSDLTGEASGP